jgi:lipoprotein-releasing system ATP-binding protein
VIADEPSGNLDPKNSENLHDLIFELREKKGTAFVIATHNRELAGRADKMYCLVDGKLTVEEDIKSAL